MLKELMSGYEPSEFDTIVVPSVRSRKIGRITYENNLQKVTEWSRGRLRYRTNTEMMDVSDDGSINICYDIYRSALMASSYSYLIDKFNLDSVMKNGQSRELSEYAKKRGVRADKGWRMLVDLHRLSDFNKPPDAQAFEAEVRDWVGVRRTHTWNGDEHLWLSKFEEKMDIVLRRSGVTPGADNMTVDDFLMNGDLWCTSGSGFEPDLQGGRDFFDETKQTKINVKKTKWSVMWKSSKYTLKKLMYRHRPQICKAVVKSEPGKTRVVISSDLSLYLKMSYVSLYLDKLLRKRKDSTLFMSKRDIHDMWQGMEADGTYRMPIDQSEFDRNVNMQQISITMKCIRRFLIEKVVPLQVIEIMDLIIESVSKGYVIVDGVKISIINGLLSGWRWTAMLGTLINLVEIEMAQEWVVENAGIDPGVLELNAQGDDDKLKMKNRKGCVCIWLALQSFSLNVNPGKFFVDQFRDEYLRRVYERGKITGYPARSVANIAFRNPLSVREKLGPERIRQSFNKWKLFCERMDVDFLEGGFFWRNMVKDSCQASRTMTKQLVNNFIMCSRRSGGMGYTHNINSIGSLLIPTQGKDFVDRISSDEIGFVEWSLYVLKFGVSQEASDRFFQSTLDISQSHALPSWVKYIVTESKSAYSVPSGLDPRPGSVGVGQGVRQLCRRTGIRWYPTYKDLVSATVYGSWGVSEVNNWESKKDIFLAPIQNVVKLVPVPGISYTAATLSDEPHKVWSNWSSVEPLLTGKPKRWEKDFRQGRLKSSITPVPGWGLDEVGYWGARLLNGAISYYLSLTSPRYSLWDDILDRINIVIPDLLKRQSVRVIE